MRHTKNLQILQFRDTGNIPALQFTGERGFPVIETTVKKGAGSQGITNNSAVGENKSVADLMYHRPAAPKKTNR